MTPKPALGLFKNCDRLGLHIKNRQWLLEVLLIAICYPLISWLALNGIPQSQYGSPVWPAAGLAIAALLALGRSRWIGISIGTFLTSHFVSHVPVIFAILAAIGPTLGSLISVTLILRVTHTKYPFHRVKHVVFFTLCVLFIGTIIQALIGTFLGTINGFIKWQEFGTVLWSWWIGDAVGVLVFAPPILAWWRSPQDSRIKSWLDWEVFSVLISLSIVIYLALINNQPVEYLLLPPLLWAAFQFGAKITTLLVTAIAMIAAIATAYKVGVFYRAAVESNSLLLLQLFIGVISITTLAVLAIVAENRQAEISLQQQVQLKGEAFAALDEVNRNLEQTVAQRTGELSKANLEITFLNQQLKAENIRMGAELAVTRQLQQMILPKEQELSCIDGLDIAGFMESADEVGGDYYDVLQQNGRVKIGIGDVTGHGLESGVIMIMVQTAIRALLANGETNPVKFLSAVNHTIYENVRRMDSGKNLSLILLDYQDNTLYLSGQHESVIIVRENGSVERIDTDSLGFPIGLVDTISDFILEAELHLSMGDVVVLYTDGITEADNGERELYGLDRLIDIVCQNHHKSVTQIRESVIQDVRSHIGTHRIYDDITLLVLKQK